MSRYRPRPPRRHLVGRRSPGAAQPPPPHQGGGAHGLRRHRHRRRRLFQATRRDPGASFRKPVRNDLPEDRLLDEDDEGDEGDEKNEGNEGVEGDEGNENNEKGLASSGGRRAPQQAVDGL